MTGHTGQIPDTLPRPSEAMEAGQMGCVQKDVDPEVFFDDTKAFEAREVCVTRCTVRAACLEWILATEQGKSTTARDGIVAGLYPAERYHLDPTTAGYQPETDPEGEELICGSYESFHRHLRRGEKVDATCWSAEVARSRYRVLRQRLPAAAKTGPPAAPVIEAALAAAAAAPEPEAPAKPKAGAAALTVDLRDLDTAPKDPDGTAAGAPATDVPDCGTEEAYERHVQLGQIVDPECWNAIGWARHRDKAATS